MREGSPGACSHGKSLEDLDCLGLHFRRFRVGQREIYSTVVKRRSNTTARSFENTDNIGLKITAG